MSAEDRAETGGSARHLVTLHGVGYEFLLLCAERFSSWRTPQRVAVTLEIALAATGLTVEIAPTGADALAALRNMHSPVRAVITDLNMPRMDGFELIRRIRKDTALARVPIIVVSGDTNPDTPALTAALGADAYFSKPYSPAIVRRTLEQLLNARANLES